MREFFLGLAAGIFIMGAVLAGAVSDRLWDLKFLDKLIPQQEGFRVGEKGVTEQKVLKEESVVIDVVERVSPSVVTVGIKKTEKIVDPFSDFFDPFGMFGIPSQPQEKSQKIEQDIGTGFVISEDGTIVTNKHVVSEANGQYRVITKDNKTYEVKNIYRDPANDLAILKIDPSTGPGQVLRPLEMGDSDNLKVGQFVIAIGTALGEFRNTVTTGVISGLGRGVEAGSPFEGYVERLDNVIQTDAAINPGNSGGPLLNSAGQVIGVNVAVASGVENIGFALPINVIKDSLANFNKTGKFSRPFLGVRYQMISQKVALMNEVPEGAYIVEVVSGSPADKAGLKEGDIIVKVDGKGLKDLEGELAKAISQKKVGETIELEVYRDEKTFKKAIVLEEFSQ